MNPVSMYEQEASGGAEGLLHTHLPLVKRIAYHLKARLPDEVDVDDLMQVGMMGLVNAAQKYDSSQGASFATYASIRIRGEMLDEVRRMGWSPRSLNKKSRDLSAAIRRVELRLGRPATDAEIAGELGVSLEEYFDISAELAGSQLVSLEASNDDEAQIDVEDQHSDTFGEVHDERFRAALKGAIGELPEKERLMMSLYYNESLNLKEIGLVMGVSESRVSQIHGQAIARLRSKLTDWG